MAGKLGIWTFLKSLAPIVSGNGYTFLLLYRLTGNEQYLDRAKAFAFVMMSSSFGVIFWEKISRKGGLSQEKISGEGIWRNEFRDPIRLPKKFKENWSIALFLNKLYLIGVTGFASMQEAPRVTFLPYF